MVNKAFLLFFLFSGASGYSAAAVRNPDTFVYAHLGEVTTLDPVYPYDAVSQGLIFNVYETLIGFRRDSLTEFVPLLASTVPSVANGLASPDGLTYSFPIRKGVKFHDNSPLLPDDVRYSLLRFILTDPAGGPASLLLEPLAGITSTRDEAGSIAPQAEEVFKNIRVEGDMVVIRLKHPFAPFLSIMARWSYVMSRSWCAAQGEWDGEFSTWRKFNNREREKSGLFDKMNGTGPFRLERWDRRAKRLFLAASGNYWRKPPALKRILLASLSEFGTRRLMLEAGDADLIDIPRTFQSQVEGIRGVRVEDNLPRLMTDPVFFFTLHVNSTGNPDIGSGVLDGNGITPDFFSDADVRKGFSCAFDYDAFIAQSLKGKARRALGSIPPGLPGYNPAARGYSFDLKKAEEHFRKAWGGKVWERGFRFTMTFNTGGDVRQLACEIMKKNIESLNPKFRIDLRGLDWPSYLEKTQNRKMPVFTRGWTGDYPDPHNFVFPFYHSRGRYPLAQGYKNPEMDRLIEKAVAAVDPAERGKLYGEIQDLAYDEAIQVYTIHPLGLYAMRSWVSGFYDNAVFMGIYFYPLSKSE